MPIAAVIEVTAAMPLLLFSPIERFSCHIRYAALRRFDTLVSLPPIADADEAADCCLRHAIRQYDSFSATPRHAERYEGLLPRYC